MEKEDVVLLPESSEEEMLQVPKHLHGAHLCLQPRLLLSTHVLMGWKIMFADIKDVFLLVSQTTSCWWSNCHGGDQHRELAAVCHVDDMMIAGQVEHLQWLSGVMKEKFVLSESGVLPVDGQLEEEAVRCLKKRHFFAKEGLVVMPHEKYVPSLLELYLERRAGKATPERTRKFGRTSRRDA